MLILLKKTIRSPLITHRAGAALLMTMVTVTVLAILIVGFMHSMRLEWRSATTHEHLQRTKLVSQGALAHAIDLLRTHIPEPARINHSAATAPATNWITNPGRLTIIEADGQTRHVPLHTGEVTNEPNDEATRDADSVDLNQPLPGTTVPAITYALNEPQRFIKPRSRSVGKRI